MSTLLHLEASTRKDSISGQLSGRLADRWRASRPGGSVVHRDLAVNPVPHISQAQAEHFMYQPGCHDEDKPADVIRCEQLMDELRSADLLLLATPMHNFTIPSTVKAWLDHVIWPGHTFDPVAGRGLLDLPAIVVLARGGGYGPGSPRADFNFQEPYLQRVLELIGITDVEFVTAELTMFTHPESPQTNLKMLGEQSLRDAEDRIDDLANEFFTRVRRPRA